jgi:acyl-CoA thioesterase I
VRRTLRTLRMPPARPAVLILLPLLSLLPAAAAAQTRYIAFGDSITFGFADDPSRQPKERGYPGRLDDLLAARGMSAEVENAGLNGESTADGVSRIDRVLNEVNGDVLLLMEGTNDVNAGVSIETIAFNLNAIADKAEGRGLEVVHGTPIPRHPEARTDGSNRTTGALAGLVRELAADNGRKLADPFEVFFHQTPNVFRDRYVGGEDKLHPNASGYDLLAKVFADVLTGVDVVPPVTGRISPRDDQQGVPPTTPIRIDLYDFGQGIDVASTRLVLNEVEVATPVSGDSSRLRIFYEPPAPLRGVVIVKLRSRDLANPANTVDRQVVQFVVAGAQFLDGDIDRDGRVDGADLVAFGLAFGSARGDSRFRTFADFDDDGRVDGDDLARLASNFGQTSF